MSSLPPLKRSDAEVEYATLQAWIKGEKPVARGSIWRRATRVAQAAATDVALASVVATRAVVRTQTGPVISAELVSLVMGLGMFYGGIPLLESLMSLQPAGEEALPALPIKEMFSIVRGLMPIVGIVTALGLAVKFMVGR